MDDLHDVFRRASWSALISWGRSEGVEDLINTMWVWYLERPETRRKMQGLTVPEQIKTVRIAAMQHLSGEALGSNTFNGRNLYSSESVKDALKGTSTNRYLVDILPLAIDELASQNEDHAEALRCRYVDLVIPRGKQQENLLVRAHKALTEHVNVIAITAGVDADGSVSSGPGSRHAMSPGLRKGGGSGHSDPTADMAIALMESGDELIELEPHPLTKKPRPPTTLRMEFEK